MLHVRYVLARLSVGGEDLPLRHGGVVIAARAESAQLDWEVVADAPRHRVDRRVHRLELECLVPDGDRIELAGDAFLVRSVASTLVFRGSGTLEGFDLGALRG